MHALCAVLVLMAALQVLFPRVIHSTTSILMLAFHAVLAKQHALQVLFLKADSFTAAG